MAGGPEKSFQSGCWQLALRTTELGLRLVWFLLRMNDELSKC